LPDDIAVREVQPTGPDFHPRFDALNRSYVYRLYVAAVRDPFRRSYAWHLNRDVDLEAIRSAAACLIGTHNFSGFGKPPQGDNPVRTVETVRWEAVGENGQYRFTITANAFLYRMVRRIVGALVLIGQERAPVEAMQEKLVHHQRDSLNLLAPPYGLTLVAVRYPEEM
jgi:tRNA pseudouridine38-40 synthase